MALNKDLDSYERGFKPFVREGLSETFKNLRFRQSLAPEGDSSVLAKINNSAATIQTLCMAGMIGVVVQFSFDIKDSLYVTDEIDATTSAAAEDIGVEGGIVAAENAIALHQDGQYYVFYRENGDGQFILTTDPEEALRQIDRELSELSRLLTMNEIEAHHDFDLMENEQSFAVTYDDITQPYQFTYEGSENEPIRITLTGKEYSASIMDADTLMQQSLEWNMVRDAIAAEGYSAETIAHMDLEVPGWGYDVLLEDAAKSIGGFTFLSLVLGFGLAGLRQTGVINPPRPTPTHKKFRRKDNAHVGKSRDTNEPGPL
jgi:hypothetical protein